MRARVQALGRDLPEGAVIPMGTDLTDRFTPDPTVPREPFLLFVGRLVRKKGVDLLLDAFASIAGDHPDLTVVVAGDGPERPGLEAQADKLGIGRRVRFLGSVPNDRLSDIYRRAAAAVFPFRREATGDQEGFGLVVVEAMGCECPVVCTDVPAVRDIFSEPGTAKLIPPETSGELASAIRRVLTDPSTAAQAARAARQFVSARFDWRHSAAGYCDLLLSIKGLR
jgi:glycosyltransferase involved in cell wall biosynthesis